LPTVTNHTWAKRCSEHHIRPRKLHHPVGRVFTPISLDFRTSRVRVYLVTGTNTMQTGSGTSLSVCVGVSRPVLASTRKTVTVFEA
jgi:hypothetical protein